ncbi:MAG: hypothetical protein GOVbin568_7 [Prokaryotic dsDNA virus sp.]|nr:MAG: hypothetical protein GOVbin568_7 [Prokaryotic dsDNA virus sp.]|tara:strand:- start:2246 stop:2662 length:417 start_codon:yes stop_codon:yes gene_type:complete
MILIKADANNSLFLDIHGQEIVAKGTTSYFYFDFINDMTQQSYFAQIAIDATTPRRYKFILNEPTTIDFAKEYGFYTYTIYQSTSNGLSDTSTFTDVNIVHKGKMHFSKTGVSEVAYTQYTPTDNTNTVNNNTQYISI